MQRLASSAVDLLGERLKAQVTDADLRLLDRYRREFGPSYEAVVASLRGLLALEPSGRPAKSTTAIVDKLKRSSMRLSQMQDIAGCRVVVADMPAQNSTVDRLIAAFPTATVVDRRKKPSHGYRAVHVVVKPAQRAVEIQIRTQLQQLWAECSEKEADKFGIELKYGGGNALLRKFLIETSEQIAKAESSNAFLEAINEDRREQIRDALRAYLGFLEEFK
jgi:putative GTP pyrophosphokinase